MLKASFILLVATLIHNLCNYFFHFASARTLSVEDYGHLGALFSMLGVFSVPNLTIMFVVSKFISEYKAQNDPAKIKYLYYYLFKKITLFGVPFLIIFLVASPFIKAYMNMNSLVPVIIIGFSALTAFYLQPILGCLQGMQYFRAFGLQSILYGVTKLVLALVFIFIGFGLSGALGGVVSANIITILIFGFYIYTLFKHTKPADMTISSSLIKYSFPVMIANGLVLLLFSSDLILLPKFFNNQEVGLYASAAILGKTVYHFPAVLVMVLFPMTAESNFKAHATAKLFYKALFMALGMAIIGSTIFYFTSDFWMAKLFGEKYLAGAPILKYIGFSLIPLVLLNIYVNYELARGKVGFIIALALSYLTFIVLVFVFHSSFYDLLKIIFISPFVCFVYVAYELIKRRISV